MVREKHSQEEQRSETCWVQLQIISCWQFKFNLSFDLVLLNSSSNSELWPYKIDINTGLVVRLLKHNHSRKSPDQICGKLLKTCVTAEHFPVHFYGKLGETENSCYLETLCCYPCYKVPYSQSPEAVQNCSFHFSSHEGVWEGDKAEKEQNKSFSLHAQLQHPCAWASLRSTLIRSWLNKLWTPVLKPKTLTLTKSDTSERERGSNQDSVVKNILPWSKVSRKEFSMSKTKDMVIHFRKSAATPEPSERGGTSYKYLGTVLHNTHCFQCIGCP